MLLQTQAMTNGKRNPAAGIMLALLAEMARSEVELLRERINSGLAEARRKGVKLGRPMGTTLSADTFVQKHKNIVRLLKEGHSVRNAARISVKPARPTSTPRSTAVRALAPRRHARNATGIPSETVASATGVARFRADFVC